MNLTKNQLLTIAIALCPLALIMSCSVPAAKRGTGDVATVQSKGGSEMLETPRRAREIWTLSLPSGLKGRVYETGIVAGAPPIVLATTPGQVLSITGQVASVLDLKQQGSTGERAILPSPTIMTSLHETPIGILLHNHHAIAGLKLVNLDGKTLAALSDARHFHYRLAPDGRSFVGIDAGGEHTALTAKTVIYRFYDYRGTMMAEVTSSHPGTQDSSYSPDGKHFLINSQRDGLSSYNPVSGMRLWNVPGAVKFFAPANGFVGRVLASDLQNRHVAALYDAGRQRWAVNLKELGLKENVRNVAISPDGKVAAISGSTLLLIMGSDTGEPLGRYQVGAKFTINSLSVSDNGLIALGAQETRAKGEGPSSGQIVVLDKAGKVVFQQQTAHQRSNAWIPNVQFDASGRFLLLRTLEAMSLLATE
ncbi:MAG TPA: WD40 repeat domain-containing protein [Patescibacteria group bacterium]|nr:WD40 repeat domain-containing protein [Patescibacteria group bacterium]